MFIEVVTTAQTTKLINLQFIKAIEPAEIGCAITYSDGDFISINDSYEAIKSAIDRLTGYEAATTETSAYETEELAITD